jgi:hypothetical protein
MLFCRAALPLSSRTLLAGIERPVRGDPVHRDQIWGVLAELEAAGLVTLADKGYQGSSYAKIPYRGKNKPASQKEANRAHARLRAPGERTNAQLKTWRILRKLRCCPGAPASSPRPSTYCRSARHKQDGKDSVMAKY